MSEQRVEARLDEVDKMGQAIGQLEMSLRESAANALGRQANEVLVSLNAQMALLGSISAGLAERRRGLMSMLDATSPARKPAGEASNSAKRPKPKLVDPDEPAGA